MLNNKPVKIESLIVEPNEIVVFHVEVGDEEEDKQDGKLQEWILQADQALDFPFMVFGMIDGKQSVKLTKISFANAKQQLKENHFGNKESNKETSK